jgi:hypothetical protein
MCIHDPLFLSTGGFNFSADGTILDTWLYFPGLKVGTINLFLDYKNRDITEYNYSRARPLTGTASSCRFCLIPSNSLSFVERLQVGPEVFFLYIPRKPEI